MLLRKAVGCQFEGRADCGGRAMQLTLFSDYALRVVIHLGCHPSAPVSVDEISRAYGISRHHLVRVVQTLVELGVVEARRGRGGGLLLARGPAEINVGWLVRRTEPHFHLAECFQPETNRCPITPACELRSALNQARAAFLDVLDGYSLDRLLGRRAELVELLAGPLPDRTPSQ